MHYVTRIGDQTLHKLNYCYNSFGIVTHLNYLIFPPNAKIYLKRQNLFINQ